jgi:DNA-binding NarL/FixJ family response regulator
MVSPRDTRILLVDEHPDARRGMALMLQASGAGTCLEARDRRECLSLVRSMPPDVAVVDLSLERSDSLRLVRELTGLHIPVVVCALHEDPAQALRALAAGARGYVTKRETRALVRTVRAVLEGWVAISPRAAQGLQSGKDGVLP